MNATAISTSASTAANRQVGTESIVQRLERNAERNPNGIGYATRTESSGTKVKQFTWKQYADNVNMAGKAMMAAGIGKGDRICIYSGNSDKWVFSHLGVGAVGGISVGAPPDLKGPQVAHILTDSGSKILFVENLKAWNKIAADVSTVPSLERVVVMSNEEIGSAKAESFTSFLARGKRISDDKLAAAKSNVSLRDCAALVYTSGSSGPPKGVMLSHDNAAHAGEAYVDTIQPRKNDRTVGAAMFAHVADQSAAINGPITAKISTLFSNKDNVKADLVQWRPTILFSVPVAWELIAKGTQSALDKLAKWPLMGALVASARAHAQANADHYYETGEEKKMPLLINVVRRFAGLDKVRIAASGAAKLTAELDAKMRKIGMPIFEALGASENTGIAFANTPGNAVFGTVGHALQGVKAWLGEDNEIIAQGRNVALGYWNNPEETAKAFDGDIYRTGDVGEIDAKGNMKIVDRLGLVFKNSKGIKVQGGALANELQGGIVQEAVIAGNTRDYNIAIIVPNPDVAQSLASTSDWANDPAVQKAVLENIAKVNAKRLVASDKIKGFFIMPRKLDKDTELTPTLKLKPKAVLKNFATELDTLYAAQPNVAPEFL